MDLMHHKCYHPFIAARHSHPQGMPGPKKGRTSPHHNHIDAIINNITSFFVRQSFFQIFFLFSLFFPFPFPHAVLSVSPRPSPSPKAENAPPGIFGPGRRVRSARFGRFFLSSPALRHHESTLFSNSALLPGISVLPVNNLQIARASLKGVGSDLTVFGYLHQQKIGAVGKGAAPDMRAVARNHHHLHRHA